MRSRLRSRALVVVGVSSLLFTSLAIAGTTVATSTTEPDSGSGESTAMINGDGDAETASSAPGAIRPVPDFAVARGHLLDRGVHHTVDVHRSGWMEDVRGRTGPVRPCPRCELGRVCVCGGMCALPPETAPRNPNRASVVPLRTSLRGSPITQA